MRKKADEEKTEQGDANMTAALQKKVRGSKRKVDHNDADHAINIWRYCKAPNLGAQLIVLLYAPFLLPSKFANLEAATPCPVLLLCLTVPPSVP
jgi:hypothetical protein